MRGVSAPITSDKIYYVNSGALVDSSALTPETRNNSTLTDRFSD